MAHIPTVTINPMSVIMIMFVSQMRTLLSVVIVPLPLGRIVQVINITIIPVVLPVITASVPMAVRMILLAVLMDVSMVAVRPVIAVHPIITTVIPNRTVPQMVMDGVMVTVGAAMNQAHVALQEVIVETEVVPVLRLLHHVQQIVVAVLPVIMMVGAIPERIHHAEIADSAVTARVMRERMRIRVNTTADTVVTISVMLARIPITVPMTVARKT